MSRGALLFLGTGGSMGVPVIGCRCDVCASTSSKNKRLRPSALLEVGEKKILIDAGPDFRTQALVHHIDRLDGVIFTHAHHDHTAAVDDLRVYNMWTGAHLSCLASVETADEIKDRFKYMFEGVKSPQTLVAKIDMQVLEKERGEIIFAGLTLRYFSYHQAAMKVTGYRLGNLGFVSDIKEYPETIFEDLAGIDTLVVSALRFGASTIHFSIEEAIEFSKKAHAKKTYLTHISHEVDDETASQRLPPNVFLAYDGLSIEFKL